jgi:hypothetical protein
VSIYIYIYIFTYMKVFTFVYVYTNICMYAYSYVYKIHVCVKSCPLREVVSGVTGDETTPEGTRQISISS